MDDWKQKPKEFWQQKLNEQQYKVTREAGTERAFTGEYCNTKTDGTYLCVCCEQPLFLSETKYDSGSGWPSFYAPVDGVKGTAIEEREEKGAWGSGRTEILCSKCGAHLGHVFPDGPKPTGLRYCLNSASLKLKPK